MKTATLVIFMLAVCLAITQASPVPAKEETVESTKTTTISPIQDVTTTPKTLVENKTKENSSARQKRFLPFLRMAMFGGIGGMMGMGAFPFMG